MDETDDAPEKAPYRPMAIIWCTNCGAEKHAPSGTRICDCPEEEPIGFVHSVEVVGEIPDDVA